MNMSICSAGRRAHCSRLLDFACFVERLSIPLKQVDDCRFYKPRRSTVDDTNPASSNL